MKRRKRNWEELGGAYERRVVIGELESFRLRGSQKQVGTKWRFLRFVSSGRNGYVVTVDDSSSLRFDATSEDDYKDDKGIM